MRSMVLALPLFLLAACSGDKVTDTLGLGKHKAPDEFEVVSRPPLVIPKEFYLEPPADTSRPPSGAPAHQVAHRMVTGLEAGNADLSLDEAQRAQDGLADTAAPVVQSGDLSSGGEESFLKKVGAEKADPQVRHEIAQENGEPERKEDPSFLDKLQGKTNEEPVLDAKGEADRLKTNQTQGKPANTGEVKTVDPADRSVLQRIFD